MAPGDLGWDEAHWAPLLRDVAPDNCQPGRIVAEHKGQYRLGTANGELWAEVAGKFYQATSRVDFPATGDFVAARMPESDGPAIIQAVLPRRTAFVRKAAGDRVEQQVVAANVDTVFIVSALDHDFNLRRLERYLTLAWESGSRPVLLLNKLDLCDDLQAVLAEVGTVALGVPVHPLSAETEEGVDALAPYLQPGRTVAVIGSSGVGKSTLINRLLGRDVQATREVRSSDSRGRHTTTHRELFVLPSGGLMIDTPGMRELQLWSAGDGLDAAFSDIENLARGCRFQNCRHDRERGCAVRAAIDRGELPMERLESYRKLGRELDYLESQTDEAAAQERKRAEKVANKAMKRFKNR